jgi:hypothetical protein
VRLSHKPLAASCALVSTPLNNRAELRLIDPAPVHASHSTAIGRSV